MFVFYIISDHADGTVIQHACQQRRRMYALCVPIFQHCAQGFCHCLHERRNYLKYLESGQTYSNSACIIDVKRVPGNKYSWLFCHLFKW